MGSMQINHYPAIIVGCGPCGLTTAINIAKAGIKTLILERWETVDKSPRAAAYQPCAQAELLETGTLDDVRAHSVINDVITFWSGGKRVAYVEKREGGKIFPAAINCPQPKLAEILLEHLMSKYEAEVRFSQRVIGVEQEGDLVRVTAEDPKTGEVSVYTADWVVGADGAGSAVRKLSGIEFEGFSWPKEDFVATNLRGYPFYEEGFTAANLVLHPEHWAVVTILDKTGLWRCAFGVRTGLTNEDIRKEVNEHYKHIFPNWEKHGACYELVELNKYKPHQRCASTFRKGKVFLAGDAAHSNNPVGGLGLTTGLLDAGPLGRGLAAVISGKAPESIMDKWAEARREKWLTYTNAFSIENKRVIQQGGYQKSSDDPLGVWEMDEVAKEHKMEHWIEEARKVTRDADEAMYKAMEDPAAQLASRMKQWDITIDPLWMAEYEDPELVKLRMSLRPAGYQVPLEA
ncbi:uncharacterized protein HMPREF1541_06399 [Cyphellophora europaea CBS 101466]|uniref:FAD-binding domain-containing protein n=1 Tax=Cyphellophora europaea (strain CBS 101466) TaxID=1220924 RepID=W2RRN9_CYPE1|nr:uncharacterized protein HMPREF1541_06399 [Cyphellophora europaea CBS 101466]ETN38364.1 hypothetical protein HMPREF1541_06399 [Cyphellophora europaea CBS 101466]